MLKILRQLNADESRQIAVECGVRPGAAAEDVIRAVSRVAGLSAFGLFPNASEELLLAHFARRLGVEPAQGGASNPRAIDRNERTLLASYYRRAWECATPERRQLVLELALAAWDNPALPRPELAALGDPNLPHPTFESLLHTAAGCRAISVATESAPLTLPFMDNAAALGFSISTFLLPHPIGQGPSAHQAMFGVLQVLWRARARLLRTRRLQRAELERHVRQADSLVQVRRRNLESMPLDWALNPACGLSLSAAALATAGLHVALAVTAPAVWIPTAVVGGAGLLWSASAATLSPRAYTDKRINRMQAMSQSIRSQLARLDREIRELEAE